MVVAFIDREKSDVAKLIFFFPETLLLMHVVLGISEFISFELFVILFMKCLYSFKSIS